MKIPTNTEWIQQFEAYLKQHKSHRASGHKTATSGVSSGKCHVVKPLDELIEGLSHRSCFPNPRIMPQVG